jgi:putative SOS response-associated peptidase YedK
MKWGLRPIQARPVSLLQAERWQITNPCLIPMNEFALKPEDSSLKYAASLITDEPFFCVAGMGCRLFRADDRLQRDRRAGAQPHARAAPRARI